jgi:hypothetical protein
MIHYLEELKGRATPPLNSAEKEELVKLRKEYEKLKEKTQKSQP